MTIHAARPAPLRVGGVVRVPGDKSISHRALIYSALADGASRIRGLLESEDIESTARVLRALGVTVPTLGNDIVVEGRGPAALSTPSVPLDCGNSGTTARLVAGLVAGLAGRSARFEGDASLTRRPMRRIAAPLREMGAVVEFVGAHGHDGLPMIVRGAALAPIDFVSPHASAQVKGAVLLAALVAGVEATVREPSPSRDHSERMLRARGVRLTSSDTGVHLAASQRLAALDIDVPGDPSSAAFFAAVAALADDGELRLEHVCLNPTRTGFFEILQRMGGRVAFTQVTESGGEIIGTVLASPAPLQGVQVGGDEIPRCIDELPLVACLAARASGATQIRDAAELRVKESDRIGAVVTNLRAIGVDVDEHHDGMTVRGTTARLRGRIRTHGDHRIAMAFGVLAALPENDIEIDDRDCVAVSYPAFWSDLERVTGERTAPVGRMIIAIDGPAASGKSSTAQWVARRLNVRHVDSGALYRALAALSLESALEPNAWTAASILATAGRIGIGLLEGSVAPLIDGAFADERLRSTAVTREVSRVASLAEVREWVNARVREAAERSDVVVDGRDIGTAVFPEAPLKVFLVADPWERARRRLRQRLGRAATDIEIAEETELLVARDAMDATQSAPARDAITIDTTRLTQEEQVERIVTLARAAWDRLRR